MANLDEIKTAIKRMDVREVVRREISSFKTQSARYDLYACPLHNEHKGASLAVYDDHWTCFGKCNASGDAIAFIEKFHSLTYTEALAYLNQNYCAGGVVIERKSMTKAVRRDETSEPPCSAWQNSAWKVVEDAFDMLWSDEGKRALAYLRGRGLPDSLIKSSMLGYVQGHFTEWKKLHGLDVPCGVLIPWMHYGSLWGVKARRAGGVRYQQVSGGNIKGALYNAERHVAGNHLIVVEGEFDCLIAHHVGAPTLNAVALGSASNHRINSRWFHVIAQSPRTFLMMDDDEAGNKANEALVKLTRACKIIRVPSQYGDINEMYHALGYEACATWLDEAVRL